MTLYTIFTSMRRRSDRNVLTLTYVHDHDLQSLRVTFSSTFFIAMGLLSYFTQVFISIYYNKKRIL